MDSVKKIAESFQEAMLHIEKIHYSLLHIVHLLPLSVKSYKSLEMQDITYVDQLLFRFLKLQDLMGKKMFTSLLEVLDEDISEFFMKDILNRLEFLRVLNAQEWLLIRGFRNGIAHEYPGEENVVVESINNSINSIPTVISIIENCYSVLSRMKIDLKKYEPVIEQSILASITQLTNDLSNNKHS